VESTALSSRNGIEQLQHFKTSMFQMVVPRGF